MVGAVLLASSERVVKFKYVNDVGSPNVTMPDPGAGGEVGENFAVVPVALITSELTPGPPSTVKFDDVVPAASPVPVTLTVSSPPPIEIVVATPAAVALIVALSLAAPRTTLSVCWPAVFVLSYTKPWLSLAPEGEVAFRSIDTFCLLA